ncbi:hypothetical protein HPB50_011978 [Hyalomma asiaticum]|uniref:Uncharacterized protein n=1 Tax=Hyalomma asiaticum TaxID=266040 RepID=A0ACB7TMU6_HYAAI|nr:hypothetical protein HPB50_011978 [Hyalomma asiaticum]
MSSVPRAVTNDVLVCSNGKANSSGCPAPTFAATAQVIGRRLQKRYVLRPGARCRVNMSGIMAKVNDADYQEEPADTGAEGREDITLSTTAYSAGAFLCPDKENSRHCLREDSVGWSPDKDLLSKGSSLSAPSKEECAPETGASRSTAISDNKDSLCPDQRSLLQELIQHPERVKLPASWGYHKVEVFHGDRIVYSTIAVVSEGKVSAVTKCIYVSEGSHEEPFQAVILNCTLNNVIDLGGERNTIEDFERMVDTLHKTKICKGGPSKEKYPGVKPQCAYIDCLGVWRHKKCAVYNTDQCTECKRLAGTLRCHAMRQRNRIDASGTAAVQPTIRNPKFDVLRRRQRLLYKKVWSSRRRLRELKNELKVYQERMSNIGEEELESLPQRLPEGQRIVVEECIKLDTCISSKGRRYSDKFLTMCLLLHIRSPAAYEFLRRNNLMPLPAVSTVRKYISLVRPDCGFDGKFFEAFKKKLLNKKDRQRHGILVFDEMQVRQGRDVNARTFSYIGQVQHDDTSEPPLADHALVFMFVPFADSYTQPVGVFASRGPTKGTCSSWLVQQKISRDPLNDYSEAKN